MSRRISNKLSSFCTVSLLAFATIFTAGCAGATSTREIALDQAEADGGAAPSQAQPQSQKAAKAETSSNVKLGEADPLARIPREPTGTVVGTRVSELYGEVVKLRNQVDARTAQVGDTRGIGASSAIQYYSAVGAIQARLQQGTTPGNPILLRQWDEANASLDQMSGSVSRLNTTSTDLSADASLAGFLQESIRAALQLSGAVDEDHVHLKQLQDIAGQQTVALDHMKTEISGELTRLNTYVATERNNMQTLAFGIEKGQFIGGSLSARPLVVADSQVNIQQATMAAGVPAYVQPMPAPMQPPLAQPALPVQTSMQPMQPAMQSGEASLYGASPAMVNPAEMDLNARSGTGLGTAITPAAYPEANQPAPQTYDPLTQNLPTLPDESANQTLAIIRFTDPNIAYEKQLYGAVSSAIDQSPNALFTVVAVAPAAGNAAEVALGTADAQRHADDVKRSLVQMGLQPSRIAMSASGDADARASEVRVLVR